MPEDINLHKLRAFGERLDRLNAEEFREQLERLKLRIDVARKSGAWNSSDHNIFRILGCARNEEVHSNVLAWLLDPEESHGIGSRFLTIFMVRVFQKTDVCIPIEVLKNRQFGSDRPDIVIRGHNWILVLENKIDAAEGEMQTSRYSERWRTLAAMQKREPFFAFVSPNGFPAKAVEFVPVSYGMIREMVEELQTGDSNLLLTQLIEHIRDDLECR